jgi:hypothetical protein
LGKDQLGQRWPLLYDLTTDPQEAYNVIEHNPQVAEKMLNIMHLWQQKTQANPGGWLSF